MFPDSIQKFGFLHPYFTLFILTIYINGLFAQQVTQQSNFNSSSPFQRELNLDSNVNLILRWSIDRAARQIVLRVESEANGYIALGLTKRGYLENSDVIILGVDNNGIPYLHDMHGVDNSTIREDETQNWQLLNGERSGDRTVVTIQRALDTCDDRDVAFNQSLILLVWDLGENHFIPTQLTVEGRAPVYFWDTREYSLDNVRDLQSWRITRNFRIPPRHTSYWCTIHKRNAFMSSKQHIVSMKAYFRDDVSMKFIHHQLLYRCTAPPGIEPSTIFERFLNHPGEECYLKDDIQLPSTLCREVVHTYGVGGEGAILPYHMGLPVGETQNEYYMFESHYDNPEMRSDVDVEHGVDFQSTPNLRPLDSGIFFVGHGILGTFVMPPQTSSFEVIGQCSSKCTSKMLPPTGVEIHIVSLHAHLSARRMRLRHFRGNQELPWILTNDNYHFDLQKGRVLVEPVTILPGDHLVLHCDYDNTWKNGSVSTVAGFSTRDEMCTAFLTVNQRLPYTYCTSEYPVDDTMSRFGIRNMTWDLELHQRVVHSAVNPSIVGLTLPEVVGNFSNWSQAEKNELERRQIFSEHTAACPNVRVFGPLAYTGVKLQELTFNILQIPFLPQANPTRSLLVTPGTFFRTRYPNIARAYTPPTCDPSIPQGNFLK